MTNSQVPLGAQDDLETIIYDMREVFDQWETGTSTRKSTGRPTRHAYPPSDTP